MKTSPTSDLDFCRKMSELGSSNAIQQLIKPRAAEDGLSVLCHMRMDRRMSRYCRHVKRRLMCCDRVAIRKESAGFSGNLSHDAGAFFWHAVLPEEAVFGQEAHAQRTAQAVFFVLAGNVDLAVEQQVKPVLAGMLRVAELPLEISLNVGFRDGIPRL